MGENLKNSKKENSDSENLKFNELNSEKNKIEKINNELNIKLKQIEESHTKIDEKNEKEIKRLIFFEEEFKINKIKWEQERSKLVSDLKLKSSTNDEQLNSVIKKLKEEIENEKIKMKNQ